MEINHCRRKWTPRLRPLRGRPDFTPFVDVLLLLFLLLTTSIPFVQMSGIEVKLPVVDTGRSRTGLERFVITVAMQDGRAQVYFNDKPLSEEALGEELSAVSQKSKLHMVIVRADASVPHAMVTKVMAIAARFGLSTFLATGQPEVSGTVETAGPFVRPGE